MNKWGIPDWRDEAAYGETEHWDTDRWRWEFVRRREDVRTAFDASCEETYQQDIIWDESDEGEPLNPSERGFTSGCSLALELGYHGIPNPRFGDQPDFALWCRNREGSIWLSYKDAHEDPSVKQLTFKLDAPIEAQLESARKELVGAQLKRHGRRIQRRHHPKKWLTYLRVLDARSGGASWADIAKILKYTAATEQNARDIHDRQAHALCFNF